MSRTEAPLRACRCFSRVAQSPACMWHIYRPACTAVLGAGCTGGMAQSPILNRRFVLRLPQTGPPDGSGAPSPPAGTRLGAPLSFRKGVPIPADYQLLHQQAQCTSFLLVPITHTQGVLGALLLAHTQPMPAFAQHRQANLLCCHARVLVRVIALVDACAEARRKGERLTFRNGTVGCWGTRGSLITCVTPPPPCLLRACRWLAGLLPLMGMHLQESNAVRLCNAVEKIQACQSLNTLAWLVTCELDSWFEW